MRILIVILFLSYSLFAQCADKDGYFAPVKFTFAAKLTNYDGQKLYFSVSKPKIVHITELEIDENTQFPVGFQKEYKSGLWFIFVCEETPSKVAWVQKVRTNTARMEKKSEVDKRLARVRKP